MKLKFNSNIVICYTTVTKPYPIALLTLNTDVAAID